MSAAKPGRERAGRAVLLAFYVLAVAGFYWKYVPLVPGFQTALLPVLVAVAVAAAVNERRGLLVFVFLFPLINNLPYFFGITEPVPFAPTALLLFLFFLGGRIVWSLRRGRGPRIWERILIPLGLAAGLVAISAVVTFWRYANFFPLGSGRVLEWAVNAHGVTSGGAFMSVLFTALNYLTSFALFLILLQTDRSRGFLLKILTALGAGALVACAFGFVQLAGDRTLGNNPLSIANEIINATFKDAMAFGGFLSMIIPLALGGILSLRGLRRAGAAVLAAAASALILAAGSKSAFFGVLAGLACFAALAAATAVRRRSEGSARPAMRRLAFVLAVAVLAFGAGVLAVRSGVIGRVRSTRTIERLARTGSNLNERIDTRWRLAWDCLAAYPLTGVGIGAYIIESSNFAAADGIPMAGPPDSAENYFLQAASELGLPGLAVFVWFLWEIVRKAQSAWGGTSARSRDRWLLAGAISGTVAYGFNIMAHSYIGSFEIKYAFWLLVAAIFMMDGGVDAAEPAATTASAQPSSRRKMTAGAALALFGAVFLWSSARSLSLAQTTKRYPIPGEVGLGKVEKTDDGREFRWSREYGGFPFRVETGTLVLPIHASHPDIAAHPVPVRFSLASDVFSRGRTLKELTLSSPDWLDVEMDLPAQDVGLRRFLLIEVGRTWNPSKMTGAPDSRNLGVALGPVRFR